MLGAGLGKVLVVDDEADVRSLLLRVLTVHGFDVVTAEDGAGALEKFVLETPSAVILDLKMPRLGGMAALEKIRELDNQVPVIILTAYGDVPNAVRAMKLGAYDFLTKPFGNDSLIATVRHATQERKIRSQLEGLKTRAAASASELMGTSPEIRRVLELVSRVAGTNYTVVIQGETGTGKELIARQLHGQSQRRGKRFVALDCGAIPETLIESELFGYERGAFTGADRRRDGLFVVAGGGTLFLDEVTNLPVVTQMKLLRSLQERCILPLGAKRAVPVDVRIIAASNIPLEKAAKDGVFRQDLYFRLNEFCITVPSLRERKEDVAYLASLFLEEACAELGKRVRGFSKEALEVLVGCSWPGNVRQLRNSIRRASLLCEGEIGPDHLDVLAGAGSPGEVVADWQQPVGRTLKEIKEAAVREADLWAIRRALSETKGNRSWAAKRLGVDYKTLYLKMKRYGIRAREFMP